MTSTAVPIMHPIIVSTVMPVRPFNSLLLKPIPDRIKYVFVSCIPPFIEDTVIQKLLQTCGAIVKWYRIDDNNNSLLLRQCGICEFESLASAVVAVKVLNKVDLIPNNEKVAYINRVFNTTTIEQRMVLKLNEEATPEVDLIAESFNIRVQSHISKLTSNNTENENEIIDMDDIKRKAEEIVLKEDTDNEIKILNSVKKIISNEVNYDNQHIETMSAIKDFRFKFVSGDIERLQTLIRQKQNRLKDEENRIESIKRHGLEEKEKLLKRFLEKEKRWESHEQRREEDRGLFNNNIKLAKEKNMKSEGACTTLDNKDKEQDNNKEEVRRHRFAMSSKRRHIIEKELESDNRILKSLKMNTTTTVMTRATSGRAGSEGGTGATPLNCNDNTNTKVSDNPLNIIDQIPTDKQALFEFNINWSVIDDNDIISNRLSKYVIKSINEYLGGDDEPTLVEFIINHLKNHITGTQLISIIQPMMDDGYAELYVIKLWRVLIYEMMTVESS